jgi:hypothetical protein
LEAEHAEHPKRRSRTVEAGSKKSLKERALGEIQKYVVITVYLWLLFALFSLHKQLSKGMGSASGSRASRS